MATEPEAHGLEDPTLLFEEYLELRDEGADPSLEDFERRAGPRLPEFRERLGLLARMEELGRVLALDEEAAAPALESLGRYEVRGLLGQGGLSRVFLAHDPELERELALKVLSPTALSLAQARTWLLSEGRSLARLDHPSVVRVHEVGEAQGFAYVAMERVRGPSLHAVLGALRAARDGDPETPADPATVRAARALEPVAARCRLVLHLARALAYCHARGVLHRDVKPGNVLLDEQHVPRLIDFGLAHHEREGGETFVTTRLFGTPAYLAPEQVDAGQSGARPASDQFALAVLLYELLTLEHPFVREARADTLTAISRADPPPLRRLDPGIHPDVERICLHALERVPARRYAGVGALADDLEAFLEHRPISLRAPTPWHVTGLWARRHARQLFVAGSAVLVALGAVGLVSWNVARGERRALLAEVEARRAGVATLEAPPEFERVFDWIAGQRYRVRELDGSAFAGSALPATLPALEELWRAASRRLHEVAEPDFAIRPRTIGSGARDDFFARAYGRWQRALNAERAPEDAPGHDRALHDQGGLDLPDGGRLFALGGLPTLPTLIEVAPTAFPEAGAYRWVRSGPARLEEVEFLHHGLAPRRAIAPRPLAPFVAAQLVPFDGPGVRASDPPVEPFAIARSVVTWGELRTLFADEELAPVLALVAPQPRPVPLGDDDPAVVPWATAHELARRAGARLPTPVELWHALRAGRLEAPRPDLLYEWTSPHLGDDGHYLRLEGLSERAGPAIFPQDDGVTTEGVGFRLARSLAR